MNIERLRRLAEVPNTPYLPSQIKNEVVNQLRELALTEKEIKTDEYGIYVRLKSGQPKNSLIVTTHLDHPGIVLKDSTRGIALGTVGLDRLQGLIANGQEIKLQIVSLLGDKKTTGQLVEVEPRRGVFGSIPWVKITSNGPVTANSHALWDIPAFNLQGEKAVMYNADNQAVTMAALSLLENLLKNPKKDLDLTVIFTFVEEVHQVSATAIGHRKATPFGPIDPNAIIIVLESMETTTTPSLLKYLEKWNLPHPSLDNGILIKINDDRVVFGQALPDSPNLAESLLLKAACDEKIAFQHTLSGGSTEAKSFTLEKLTSNIACLVVPCKNKHNWSPKGDILAEEVYLKDIEAAVKVLERVCETTGDPIKSVDSLSKRAKKSDLPLTKNEFDLLARQRKEIAIAARSRLRGERYFPENFYQKHQIAVDRAKALIKSRLR